MYLQGISLLAKLIESNYQTCMFFAVTYYLQKMPGLSHIAEGNIVASEDKARPVTRSERSAKYGILDAPGIWRQSTHLSVTKACDILSKIAKYAISVDAGKSYVARPSQNVLGQTMPRCKDFAGSKENVETMCITTLKPNTQFGPVIAARIVSVDGFDVMVPSVVNKDEHAENHNWPW